MGPESQQTWATRPDEGASKLKQGLFLSACSPLCPAACLSTWAQSELWAAALVSLGPALQSESFSG